MARTSNRDRMSASRQERQSCLQTLKDSAVSIIDLMYTRIYRVGGQERLRIIHRLFRMILYSLIFILIIQMSKPWK